MRVLIVGAAGMIGGRLACRLDEAGSFGSADRREVTDLLLVDRSRPAFEAKSGVQVETASADIADPSDTKRLAGWRPDVLFHLAAVVSGEAESRFELGYAVNVKGTWALLDALREAGRAPRFVFASSLAVYGPPFPTRCRTTSTFRRARPTAPRRRWANC